MNVLRKTLHQSINMSTDSAERHSLQRWIRNEAKTKCPSNSTKKPFNLLRNVLKGFDWNWQWPNEFHEHQICGAKFNISAKFQFFSNWKPNSYSLQNGPLKVFKVSVMGTLCSDYSHIFSKKCILGGFVRRFKEHWLFHRGLFEQSLMWCNLALKQNTTTLEKSKSSQFGLKIISFSQFFWTITKIMNSLQCP